MKRQTLWIAALAVVSGLTPALSAATYTNDDVTLATLAEQGAVNLYTAGYTSPFGTGTNVAIGNGVSGVSFSITDAADMRVKSFYVGYGAGSDNCSAIVSGTTIQTVEWAGVGADTWSGSGGTGGNNCSLTIQDGGIMFGTDTESYRYVHIGADSGVTGAALTVTGDGSLFMYRRIIEMGGDATITVENGGMVASTGTSGGLYSSSSATVRLNGGYAVFAQHLPSESNIELWNGSSWVLLSTLDQAQRDALGFSATAYADSAAFEAGTGLTDPGLLYTGTVTGGTGVMVYTAIPEPATMGLLAFGGAMGLRRYRRRV